MASGSARPPVPEDETALALPPPSDGAAIGPLVGVIAAGVVVDDVSLRFGGCSIFIVRGTWNASRASSRTPPTAA